MEVIPDRLDRHFNSQPHKEADELVLYESVRIRISTHSLTRRLTQPGIMPGFSWRYFNSQPHKEADNLAILSS